MNAIVSYHLGKLPSLRLPGRTQEIHENFEPITEMGISKYK
jgi:hypothetical protein